jgi:plastocyanin
MGLRRCAFLLVCALLGAAVAVLPAIAGSETAPTTVTALNSEGIYKEQRHYWSPATLAVVAGAVVAFANPSAEVRHGVEWTGGPAPSCSGLPGGAGAYSWHGECTFAQPGTYSFRCTVHPTEMTGTVTVGSAGTTTTTTTTQPGTPSPGGGVTTTQSTPQPLVQLAPASLLAGPSSQALRLAASQRGSSVRGVLDLAPAGSGGRLEVDLLARRASLAAAHGPGQVQVGRLVRSRVLAGRVSFRVPLSPRAARALRIRRRLALAVRIVITAPGGTSLQIRRTVLLHA